MNIKKIVYSLMSAIMVLFMANSCSPDSYSLGTKDLTSDDLAEGIGFTIEHDSNNPNIIHLTSLVPSSYQVLWEHPQGRAHSNKVTLQIAFPGTYTVRMGVETRGGVVYSPEATFTVDDFCADFVNDELWTILTGGVGNSKKWYLDLDANAVCRYFAGPLYFYGTDDSWNTVTLDQTVDGDSWSWGADWAGNSSWLFGSTGAIDFGYMEFSLQDGAKVTVVDNAHGRIMNGTFLMDVDNHTMSMTDAEIIHDPGRDAIVTKWGNITILALDDSHMQLAVLRDNDPNEGPCLLSYNFISEDYLNNWSPETSGTAEIVPELQSDWREYVEPKTQKQMTFKLAADDKPFDWMNLDGSNMGIEMSAQNSIEDLTLEFDSNGNTYKCTTPDGTSVSGTYTLSDDGIYTFSDGLPVVQLSSNARSIFKANTNNTLRIMSIEVDDYTGGLGDLWLGSQEFDDQGNLYQYAGYHFKPVVAGADSGPRYTANINFFDEDWTFINGDNVFITGDGNYTFTIEGASSKPYGIYLDVLKILADYPNMDMTITDIRVDGASIEFDDAVIDRGEGDAATTARRYILNPWGATAGDAPKYVFSSKIEVDLHVVFDNGTPFVPANE